MALKTKCLTPGTKFSTHIDGNYILVDALLPFDLEVDEEEAKILDKLLHNSIEIVLRPYFLKKELES